MKQIALSFGVTLTLAFASAAYEMTNDATAFYRADNHDGNIAFGRYVGALSTSARGNVLIGSQAAAATTNVHGSIAIGNGALKGSPYAYGSVAIGEDELAGYPFNHDTTSINGEQIWFSQPADAFSLTPRKRDAFTNSVIWYKRGDLHLNARRIMFNGEATGLTMARVTKDAYSRMYIPHTVDLPLQNGYAEIDFGTGRSKGKIWMTNTLTRLEYQLAIDSDTIVSARVYNVTIGHAWNNEHIGSTWKVYEWDYCVTNSFVIPLAADGKTFAKNRTAVTTEEYPFVGYYYRAFSVVTTADGTGASIKITDGGHAPTYHGDDMLSHTVTCPDPHVVRCVEVPTCPLADERPVRGNVTNLITSAGVAEHCALNAEVGLKRVDGYQFVSIYPQQAHVDETTGEAERLIYRIDMGITEAAARAVMEQQTPDADGYYTAAGFTHFRIYGIRTFCGEGYYGKYVTYDDWRTDPLYTTFEGEESQISFYIEPYNYRGYFDVSMREENVQTGSVIWSEDFHIPYPVLKFKPKDGIQYAADSTVSKSCLSTTKFVDNRLGGLSLKNENGAISVYSGGVKIGTLTLNPTP